MVAVMPPRVFNSYDLSPPSSPPGYQHHQNILSHSISSPLSSPSIRVTSLPFRETLRRSQSSPIRGLSGTTIPDSGAQSTRSRFALMENPRPNLKQNPLAGRRRMDAQEGRRRLFLKNVRQRSDDKQWERRGGDNELLKLEWQRFNHELRQAKNNDLDGIIYVEDFDEIPDLFSAVPFWNYTSLKTQDQDLQTQSMSAEEDAAMLDAIEQQEEAEIEALITSLPEPSSEAEQRIATSWHHQRQYQQSDPPIQLDSPSPSDDEEYDAIFSELVAGQEGTRSSAISQDVEMT